MSQAEIQLKQNLISIIQDMDSNLIQRLSDYAHGLVDAKEDVDGWESLPEKDQKGILRGLDDAKHGRLIPHEVVMAEIKKRVNL